ncbi:MAG TPA: OsmC family protein [Desulfotignum sp.]|nr:OsmC family protein [Desulfotignum sp.]
MTMEISFPGNKKVVSLYKGFSIETDQPKDEGGDGSAPEPFDLFLSAMGTCAGIYVIYFCEERNIDTTGMKMSLSFDRNEQTHLIETVHIQISLPPGFPKKYRSAVEKTAGLCTVKRNILNPPRFEISAQIQDA